MRTDGVAGGASNAKSTKLDVFGSSALDCGRLWRSSYATVTLHGSHDRNVNGTRGKRRMDVEWFLHERVRFDVEFLGEVVLT